jgi:hypothetical protein
MLPLRQNCGGQAAGSIFLYHFLRFLLTGKIKRKDWILQPVSWRLGAGEAVWLGRTLLRMKQAKKRVDPDGGCKQHA